jgi:hypothetical protein
MGETSISNKQAWVNDNFDVNVERQSGVDLSKSALVRTAPGYSGGKQPKVDARKQAQVETVLGANDRTRVKIDVSSSPWANRVLGVTGVNLSKVDIQTLIFLVYAKAAKLEENSIRQTALEIERNNRIVDNLQAAMTAANNEALAGDKMKGFPSDVRIPNYTDPDTGDQKYPDENNRLDALAKKYGVPVPGNTPWRNDNDGKESWKQFASSFKTKADTFTGQNQLSMSQMQASTQKMNQDYSLISDFTKVTFDTIAGIIRNLG